ncbi:HET-domain-containing protein [Hyaloscypha variabilis F]|uniref:HET-domain-containing protein n=1 Tax=Hyaloscypha variabilis (strain UAMH 11265 / GT02V1 / F) TaxID=1149755 RepID=A0A2J6RCN7_HYAVF|nr:HET-domain-containing protein [Hyaloscypha variabilis F]
MSSSAHHSASPPLQDQPSISQASGKTPIQGSYQYQPLPSHEHFRILELLPNDAAEKGGSGGVVRCRLHTEPFADAEDTYAALSYVWGDASDRVPMICDGKIVKVTVNLADALRHIRDHTEFRFVWADAICIDQEDDVEKGHQVKRMGMIYEHAVEVLVWLGKDDEGIAEDCFNLIRETNEYLDYQLAIYGDIEKIPTITRASPISFEELRWNKVEKLKYLPWFSRLWVLQEAALAKQCQLLWGQHQLNLAELCEISSFLAERPDLLNLVRLSETGRIQTTFLAQCTYRTIKTWMDTKPLIKRELKRIQETEFMNLLDVLESGRNLAVTFEIDRVYAFLGNPLARKYEEQTLLIEPDYGKSMQEVYFEVACELLAHPREAPYLLSRADHHHSDCVEGMTLGRDGAFPSWVPRWDKGWRQYAMSAANFWYQSGGVRKVEATVQDDQSLLLSGIIFDQIVWVSDIINDKHLILNPDDWDEGVKTSKEPFIDLLFSQVQQARYQHRTGRNSKLLASNMSIENAFYLTMVRHYPTRDPLSFDLIQCQREYSAYLQAARQHARTLKGRKRIVISKWLKYFRHIPKPSQIPDSVQAIGDTSPFLYESKLDYAHARCFAITKSGRFGLVPWLAQPEDVCCIFPGMQVPLILRPRKDGRYGLVGDSYIHGVMGGEVMEQLEKGEMKLENIVLV